MSFPPLGCYDNAMKLFIGNIPKSLREDQILPLFERFGKVVELVIIKDRKSQESKGSGFVWYATRESALQAIEHLDQKCNMNDTEGEDAGDFLVVREAAPPKSRPSSQNIALTNQACKDQRHQVDNKPYLSQNSSVCPQLVAPNNNLQGLQTALSMGLLQQMSSLTQQLPPTTVFSPMFCSIPESGPSLQARLRQPAHQTGDASFWTSTLQMQLQQLAPPPNQQHSPLNLWSEASAPGNTHQVNMQHNMIMSRTSEEITRRPGPMAEANRINGSNTACLNRGRSFDTLQGLALRTSQGQMWNPNQRPKECLGQGILIDGNLHTQQLHAFTSAGHLIDSSRPISQRMVSWNEMSAPPLSPSTRNSLNCSSGHYQTSSQNSFDCNSLGQSLLDSSRSNVIAFSPQGCSPPTSLSSPFQKLAAVDPSGPVEGVPPVTCVLLQMEKQHSYAVYTSMHNIQNRTGASVCLRPGNDDHLFKVELSGQVLQVMQAREMLDAVVLGNDGYL